MLPGLLQHVTLPHQLFPPAPPTPISHHSDLEVKVQKQQDLLKELEIKDSNASPHLEPDLHLEDLRRSPQTVSFSWKGQGCWNRAGLHGGRGSRRG